MSKKEIPTSVSVITEITNGKTLDCDLFGHRDHSHGILYSTSEVISAEYFFREFASPFEVVRENVKQLQDARDKLREQIVQTQKTQEDIPQKIAECLEKSLSDDAPFFRNLRKITAEHVAEVAKAQNALQKKIDEHFLQVQKQRQDLEAFQKSSNDRFQKLEKLKDLAAGMEKAQQELRQTLNETVQRQETLSQEVENLRAMLQTERERAQTELSKKTRELENRIAALEKPSGPSPDDFRKLESRIAALEKPSGPSPDDIRELGNRIAALEKNRNAPGESSPVPSLSGTWRTWLARLFGKRGSQA